MLFDINQLMESAVSDRAESMFEDMLEIVKKHGVCYFRFTREDGIIIVNPKYNAKLNGVISDA